MSVRSFHSVFMASAVAGAALGCYLVSLRVASERAALEEVESAIVGTQSDIRLLQTEVGTRSRLAQLERWNARALALSAPAAGQILGDRFQLASLVRPERKLDVEAPVVLASAPAPQPGRLLEQNADTAGAAAGGAAAPATELLHQASLKVEPREPGIVSPSRPGAAAAARPAEQVQAPSKVAASVGKTAAKKAGEKLSGAASTAVTRPIRTAKVDPLAPLAAGVSTNKGSRTDR